MYVQRGIEDHKTTFTTYTRVRNARITKVGRHVTFHVMIERMVGEAVEWVSVSRDSSVVAASLTLNPKP